MNFQNKDNIKFVLTIISVEVLIVVFFSEFVTYDGVQANASDPANSFNTARGGIREEKNTIQRFDSSKKSAAVTNIRIMNIFGFSVFSDCFLKSCNVLNFSVPRCACDDICWIWLSDDLSPEVRIQRRGIQYADRCNCHPVVHFVSRNLPSWAQHDSTQYPEVGSSGSHLEIQFSESLFELGVIIILLNFPSKWNCNPLISLFKFQPHQR
jgi:hypothetical protein